MPPRNRLVRSIPFWALVVGSLAFVGVGAWLVIERLGALSSGIRGQSADPAEQLEITVNAYVAPAAATVGGVILGAGLVGLLLALTLATLSTLLPQPAIEIVEPIDWSTESDEEPETVEVVETVSEAPDVEVPSDAPAPAAATEPPAEPTR